jgi:hypothetical protein
MSSESFDTVDVVLVVLTIVPLLFVLMFATSAMTEALRRRSARRRLGVALLAMQVLGGVLIAGVVAT